MQKPLLLLLMFMMSFNLMAQNNNSKASFESKQVMLADHEAQTWSDFTLETTQSRMDELVEQLAPYKREFHLDVLEKVDDTHFKCRLVYEHHVDLIYLHKIFKLMGISEFELDGETHPLDHLPAVKR